MYIIKIAVYTDTEEYNVFIYIADFRISFVKHIINSRNLVHINFHIMHPNTSIHTLSHYRIL